MDVNVATQENPVGKYNVVTHTAVMGDVYVVVILDMMLVILIIFKNGLQQKPL